MFEHQVVEIYPDGREFAAGSVIQVPTSVPEREVYRFFRDIRNKNIMHKHEWDAIYVDCCILDYLKKIGIPKLYYYNWDTDILLVANISDFNNVDVVMMANRDGYERPQKGLRLERWAKRKLWFSPSRPERKIYVPINRNNKFYEKKPMEEKGL